MTGAHWVNGYVGIPFRDLGRDSAGTDCWGLACTIYRQELGIELPRYLGYSSSAEDAEVAATVAGATSSPVWQAIAGEPAPFDIAVFRRGALQRHVGIVIFPGTMIHMSAYEQARIENYRAGRWASRFTGHFRWVYGGVEGPVKAGAEGAP